ncbi:hypothetical protein [Streptomyces sp. NBC_01207]|uniref:hypothetical protein n=1 Tax=Streptomyces sp. NBC_01207 TaxID=2903772 RepID=UPI002E113E5D|nr:hypothetical protein OG457_27300 [Streptomyces sp. NBC_01207]
MGILPALGTGGAALALTAVLWFGTSQGGKGKQLSWGWCLFLALVAGAAFKAAGDPLGFSGLVTSSVEALNGIVPGVTVAALGVIMLAVIIWKKLTLRGISMCGIFFFFVMAATTGTFGKASVVIANIANNLANG